MSYAHGTSLSFANNTESATVLSDDKVLVTKCLNTDCQIEMPLSEWLELSRGKEQVEFIPVPLDSTNIESDEDSPCSKEVCSSAFEVYAKGRMAGRSHDDMVTEHGDAFRSCIWCNPKEMPCYPGSFCGKAYSVYVAGKTVGKKRNQISNEENKAFQACETCNPKINTYPIGTMLRWKYEAEGEETTCTAVITKLGVLQVKVSYPDITPGTTVKSYNKILFPTITKWRESLPDYGYLSITKGATPLNDTSTIMEGLTDYESLIAITKRFNVRQVVQLYKSPLEIQEINLKGIEYSRDFLAKRSLNRDLTHPEHRKGMTDFLLRQINRFNDYQTVIDNMSEVDKNYRRPFDIFPKGESRLYAYVNRRKRLIAPYNGKIAIIGLPMATTFQESGIDYYDGKPRLVAVYRKKEIKLY